MEPRSILDQWVRALGTTTDIFGKEDIDHLVNVNKAKAKTLEAIKALQRLTPIQHDRDVRAHLEWEVQFAMDVLQNDTLEIIDNITEHLNLVVKWARQPKGERPSLGGHNGPTPPDTNDLNNVRTSLTLNEMKKGERLRLDVLEYECFPNRIRHIMHAYDIFKTAKMFPTPNVADDPVHGRPHLYRKLYMPPGQRCTWEIIRGDGVQPLTSDHKELYTVVKDKYHLLAEYSEKGPRIHVYSSLWFLMAQLHVRWIIPHSINDGKPWSRNCNIEAFFPLHECKAYIEVAPRSPSAQSDQSPSSTTQSADGHPEPG